MRIANIFIIIFFITLTSTPAPGAVTNKEYGDVEQCVKALLSVKTFKSDIEGLVEAIIDQGPDAQRWAINELADALLNDPPYERARAATALRMFGPLAKDAVPALIKALSDEEYGVRNYSVQALGAIGLDAASAVPSLISMSNDGSIKPAWDDAIINICKNNDLAIPYLLGIIRDGVEYERSAAAYALAFAGTGEGVEQSLDEALNDESDSVREAVGFAIDVLELGGPIQGKTVQIIFSEDYKGSSFSLRKRIQTFLESVGFEVTEESRSDVCAVLTINAKGEELKRKYFILGSGATSSGRRELATGAKMNLTMSVAMNGKTKFSKKYFFEKQPPVSIVTKERYPSYLYNLTPFTDLLDENAPEFYGGLFELVGKSFGVGPVLLNTCKGFEVDYRRGAVVAIGNLKEPRAIKHLAMYINDIWVSDIIKEVLDKV